MYKLIVNDKEVKADDVCGANIDYNPLKTDEL